MLQKKERTRTRNFSEDEILTISDNMSSTEKHKILMSQLPMFLLIDYRSFLRVQDINAECIFILQKIVSKCKICQRHGKAKPKPAVGFPLAL